MSAQSIREIVDYLRRLAPSFFAERMRGATERELAQLEQAAGTPLSESHREFLRQMGASEKTALYPFLKERNFGVNQLLASYEALAEEGERLPARVVLFAVSEEIETLVLRNGSDPGQEPEIGGLRFEDPEQTAMLHGVFVPDELGKFEDWLRWFTFMFRLGQPDHEMGFESPWNASQQRWEGRARALQELFAELGFQPIFRLPNDLVCLERGNVAAMIYGQGSGTIAGADLAELERIASLMKERAPLHMSLEPESNRLHSPRE